MSRVLKSCENIELKVYPMDGSDDARRNLFRDVVQDRLEHLLRLGILTVALIGSTTRTDLRP